jgi:MarR family transcriptional regulator, organic hydroperoxide resistance regulator
MKHSPEDWLGYWIKNVERTINNIHDKKLSQYDLTSSQVLILSQLWKKDGLTQKEIQENLNLKPASVSGLVDILLKKGFIDRKQDEEDARFKRLHLTEEGCRLKGVSLDVLKEVEHIISKDFSKEEEVILICWIKKLYNNLKLQDK